MKPAPFEYIVPDSMAAALTIMEENGFDAKLLAGGQSLIPAMNFRLVQPTLMVDLNKLSELDYVRKGNKGNLLIGAMTRQRRLERDPLVSELAPLLAEAVPFVAHPQIRNRGTIGGSLAHADPAAELPVIMVALNAQLRMRRLSGDRWVEAKDFFHGLFTTDLAPEEILVEISIPQLPSRTGWSFKEFARRKGDYALLGVAALLTLDGANVCRQARLVYLSAGDVPVEAPRAASVLVGEVPSVEHFETAAAIAAGDEVQPTGDIHASAPYLRHLAGVLTRRALETAYSRALEHS